MSNTNEHPLLSRLKSRADERQGKLVDFPIEIKDKITVNYKVWVQPIYADEADSCKIRAGEYCKGRFDDDDDATIDAQNVEAIGYAYRDADDHSVPLFHSAKEIRTLLTPDEIALLIHQLNLVTYSLSSWKITEDKHASIQLAEDIAKNQNTELVELMHATELTRIVLDLSNEIGRLKKQLEIKEINGRRKG